MRGTPALITAQTAAAMHTRRKKTGLGFGVAVVAGLEDVATHSGSADTFEDVAVAVSTNAAGEREQKAVGQILRELLTRYATRR